MDKSIDSYCPKCDQRPGDECVTPEFKTTKEHASRVKYSQAMQIDRDHGLTAARKFLPTYAQNRP